MLRGTSAGLEFVFAGHTFDEAWTEMSDRLAERPDFYRGSRAVAIFGELEPTESEIQTFLAGIAGFEIALQGLYGGREVAAMAARHELTYLGEPPKRPVASFERKRASRAERPAAEIPERAKSLDADFAGARADIAKRRALGEPSVPRPNFAAAMAAAPPLAVTPALEIPKVGTLYHRGTLRGGQTLQQLGAIVVVGDVNPGAELVATGDIVVFGALRGTAHAGAQGDLEARVFALDLSPTQLRIATLIAVDDAKTDARHRARSRSRARRKRTHRDCDTRRGTNMSGRRIVVTSGKGGVGKTTTTANVGAALAKRGQQASCSIDTPISACAISTSCSASRSASSSISSRSSKAAVNCGKR